MTYFIEPIDRENLFREVEDIRAQLISLRNQFGSISSSHFHVLVGFKHALEGMTDSMIELCATFKEAITELEIKDEP